jgi:dCMP deaminase
MPQLLSTYLSAIKRRAIKENLPFAISPAYLKELYAAQDRRCALSKVALVLDVEQGITAMLDCVEPARGYIEGNVRWLHKEVYRMRGELDDRSFIEWSRRCFLGAYELDSRPTVHEHFLMQAFVVALRAEDVHTKHGAIIVENTTNHPIGSGYNGLFRGMPADQELLERPEKYAWMIHAEENAIMNCTKNPLSLPGGARLYVTGAPCNNCLQRVINFGIRQIFVARRQGTLLESEVTRARQAKILRATKAEINEIELSNRWLQRVFL